MSLQNQILKALAFEFADNSGAGQAAMARHENTVRRFHRVAVVTFSADTNLSSAASRTSASTIM